MPNNNHFQHQIVNNHETSKLQLKDVRQDCTVRDGKVIINFRKEKAKFYVNNILNPFAITYKKYIIL